VKVQYILAPLYVGTPYHYAAVKSPRAHNSRVKDIGAVRSGQNNYAFVDTEAVHFNK
jgi:hypothetical protein